MRMKELLLWSFVACLLSACTAEELPGSNEQPVAPGKEGIFTFNLSTSSSLSVNTRMHYDLVNDIWVVQLNAVGTAALVPPARITTITDNKIRVKLKAEQSKIYFFVNTEKADLFDPTAELTSFTTASVEATSLAGNTDWDSKSYMPMFGVWGPNVPTTPTISGEVQLTRTMALVSITVNDKTGGKLSVKSMQLKNVPNVMRMCPLTTGTYPAATGSYLDYSVYSPEYTYYSISRCMPENCRGTGNGRYETEKIANTVTNGAYATYCEIKGKYNGKIDVTYRFYLGENNTNDYNVRRNTDYSFNISIMGINEMDMRVTVETASFSGSSNTGITWGDGNSENVNGTI